MDKDRVELTLAVSGITFSNYGDAEFQSLPDNNPWQVLPFSCTNSSESLVKIPPVNLHPWYIHWSSTDSTQTESPTTPHYVTVGEEFNMTVLACMPESVTSVLFTVYLPETNLVPLVSVDDAYVTFVGSEVHNTTLAMSDCKLKYFPSHSC